MCSARARASGEVSDFEVEIWSVCWQAAVGRRFDVPASLSERIRSRLIGAHQQPGRALLDFVMLPTEIHAITQVRAGDSVTGVARAFGNVVARWVRAAQPVRSPVLAGPYRALSIGSDEAFRQEVRMLAWRPVFLKLCSTPTYHAHGALRISLGLATSRGFDARHLLSHFGEPVPAARAALRRWIARRPSDEEWRVWELTRGLTLATGSVGPHPSMARSVEGAAAMLIAAGGGYGIDGALKILETWICARIHPAAPLDLHASSGAAAARGRALVAVLAVNHRLCSAASVARYFHRAKSTLSEQMTICRKRPADRLILSAPLRRILDDVASLRPSANGVRER